MKKLIPLLIIISILCLVIPAKAAVEEGTSPYILEADKLNALNLFLGTDLGYELLRIPRRAEAAVMLVRLLGREDEALSGSFEHPFTDVPEWADPYVGLLYEAGLAKGIGEGLYDPYSDVDARTYLTFLLRALGYSEEEGNFYWETAVGDAALIGLISNREYEVLLSEEFTRGHMAALSYNALNSAINNSNQTLAGELAERGAIEESDAINEHIDVVIPLEKHFLPYLIDGEYMPNLTGVDFETAQILMRKAGIELTGYNIVFDEIVPKNCVTAQSWPAYINSGEIENCSLTLSLGPSPSYHEELLEICRQKGWDDEITTYIIASAKYLIKNTVLNKYDVFRKLGINLNEIVILNDEDSAALGYSALYDAATKNMYINKYMLDFELILHELAHAISNNNGTGKVGFHANGSNTRLVSEAFVEGLSSKARGDDSGALNYFRVGEEKIIFSSDSYFCDSDNNFILSVFSPLFVLAGENTIEKMFFYDISDYSREVLKFNERYGEQRWETLWSLADSFISKTSFLSEDDRIAKALVYREYLDEIIDCLYISLESAGIDESTLRLLLLKTREIKGSYPLNYSDYREQFNMLETDILNQLEDDSQFADVAGAGQWIIPDYSGKYPEYVYNSLTIAGSASGIGYMVISSDDSISGIAGVLYKEPGMPIEEAVELTEGDIKSLGGEYFIMIVEEKLPEGDYTIMRDLKNDFSKYLADYSKLSDYAVGRLLNNEGFNFRYEFSYFTYVTPEMQGRIVGQFPEPGSAIIPGTTIIRIYMLKEKP